MRPADGRATYIIGSVCHITVICIAEYVVYVNVLIYQEIDVHGTLSSQEESKLTKHNS